jgi:hypothetical protein
MISMPIYFTTANGKGRAFGPALFVFGWFGQKEDE